MVKQLNNEITLILFLVAALHLATAQKEQITTIPTVILDKNGEETCPSLIKIEEGLQTTRNSIMTIFQNYTVIPQCGEGLWYRVAYLNMTDPSQQCPTTWRLYSDISGVRACGRSATSGANCSPTFYPTSVQYSKVCGKVIGYQKGSTGAFAITFLNQPPTSLDDIYVDGVSITYGHPRSLIWTFAAGTSQQTDTVRPAPQCLCSRQGATQAPSYVGNNYYCESGNNATTAQKSILYSSDPLWDGKQCEGQCCSNGKSPPWFSVELPNSTTDDIEVRICADEGTDNEDTPISLLEIYVK